MKVGMSRLVIRNALVHLHELDAAYDICLPECSAPKSTECIIHFFDGFIEVTHVTVSSSKC